MLKGCGVTFGHVRPKGPADSLPSTVHVTSASQDPTSSWNDWLRAAFPGAWCPIVQNVTHYITCMGADPTSAFAWRKVWPGATHVTALYQAEYAVEDDESHARFGGSDVERDEVEIHEHAYRYSFYAMEAAALMKYPHKLDVCLWGIVPAPNLPIGKHWRDYHRPKERPRAPVYSHPNRTPPSLTTSFEDHERANVMTCAAKVVSGDDKDDTMTCAMKRIIPDGLVIWTPGLTASNWDLGLVIHFYASTNPGHNIVIITDNDEGLKHWSAPDEVGIHGGPVPFSPGTVRLPPVRFKVPRVCPWILGCIPSLGVRVPTMYRDPTRMPHTYLLAAPRQNSPLLDLDLLFEHASRDEDAGDVWQSPSAMIALLGALACAPCQCPWDPLVSEVVKTAPAVRPSTSPTTDDDESGEKQDDEEQESEYDKRPLPGIWKWVESARNLRTLRQTVQKFPAILQNAVKYCVQLYVGAKCPMIVDTIRYTLLTVVTSLPLEMVADAPEDATAAELWAWAVPRVLVIYGKRLSRVGVHDATTLFNWVRLEAHRMAWTLSRAKDGSCSPSDTDDQNRSLWGWDGFGKRGVPKTLAPIPYYYHCSGDGKHFSKWWLWAHDALSV